MELKYELHCVTRTQKQSISLCIPVCAFLHGGGNIGPLDVSEFQ